MKSWKMGGVLLINYCGKQKFQCLLKCVSLTQSCLQKLKVSVDVNPQCIQAKVGTFTQFSLKMYTKQTSLDEGFG